MCKPEPPECLYWETMPPRKKFGVNETQGKGTHLVGYCAPPPSFADLELAMETSLDSKINIILLLLSPFTRKKGEVHPITVSGECPFNG